jgi:glycosyltransferase involved in cell wall biosynthesis
MAALARRLDVPLVVTFHGYDGSQLLRVPGYRKALAGLFEAAAAVICVCGPMRERLVAAGCPDAKAHVRHLGIDTARFEAADRGGRTGPVRVLQVAGLSEKKGVPTALRAFARARDGGADLHFTLAGDGPARGEIVRLAADLSLGEAFDDRGAVPHAEAARLMAEADVFVHPSQVAPDGDREGLPTAIMEAMATGLPVLSTRHEGIPELVIEGESGRLVPEGDVEGLAAGMVEFAESAELRRTLGDAGAARVREHFDLRRKVSELEEFYEELLSRT